MNWLQPARNVPVAASVGRRHIARGREHATLLALRALPAGVRRRVAGASPDARSWAVSPAAGSVVRLLALAAAGSPEIATELTRASAGATGRRLERWARAAVAVGALDVAEALVDRVPPGHRRDRLAALVAAASGEPTTARSLLRAAGHEGGRLDTLLAADLATLLPPAEVASLAPRGGIFGPPRRQVWSAQAGPFPPPRGAIPATSWGSFRHLVGPNSPLRPGRVLHLVTNSLPETVAGYTLRTQGIVAAQRAAGIDAQVVTRLGFPVTRGHLRAGRYAEVEGVPYHRLLGLVPARADEALARDVELTVRLVERLRPDVLHAHSNHLNAQVALAVRERTGIPVVYELRGFLEETRRSLELTRPGREMSRDGRDGETYRLTRAAETWCLRRADAVVTLGSAMRDEIVARGADPDRVVVVPNAVSDQLPTHPSLAARVRLRTWLGIAPDTLLAGFVGTLNDYEGVDVLIRAIAMASHENAHQTNPHADHGATPGTSDLHLVVVGDGPARGVLERAAGDLPATFVGRVPPSEVPDWYAAVDVCCVPRRDLPVTRLVPPLKPAEAMAMGRPVIASDLPPLREIVTDWQTGLLVPPDDPAALVRALTLLASEPDVRHRLGTTAREHVRTRHTWSATTATYADTYAGVYADLPTASCTPLKETSK